MMRNHNRSIRAHLEWQMRRKRKQLKQRRETALVDQEHIEKPYEPNLNAEQENQHGTH